MDASPLYPHTKAMLQHASRRRTRWGVLGVAVCLASLAGVANAQLGGMGGGMAGAFGRGGGLGGGMGGANE